jgi:hypothetical protein
VQIGHRFPKLLRRSAKLAGAFEDRLFRRVPIEPCAFVNRLAEFAQQVGKIGGEPARVVVTGGTELN